MEEFKRGDHVLVWGGDDNVKGERIFLAKIEGAATPYICVGTVWEKEFLSGESFGISVWSHCEKMPEKSYRPLVGKELAQLYMETIVHPELGKYIVCGVFFDRREIVYLRGKDGIQFAKSGENLLNDGWTWNGKPIGVEE